MERCVAYAILAGWSHASYRHDRTDHVEMEAVHICILLRTLKRMAT